MNIRDLLQRQPVLPAPMCGISDFSFRALCRRMGGECTFTQMVSAEAIYRGDRKSLEILDQREPEPLLAMQLFGSSPQALAEGVRVLQDRGAAFIDLNMGCPARKITGNNAGSALLRELPLVGEILKAMRAAAQVPLTVKMRWDWAEGEGEGAALQAARMAEGEGFAAVCLHARTREQGYSGDANWELIARMKEAVTIPVIGNGDIRQPADALEMVARSGCDAVMIGRALIGDPWLMQETLAALAAGCTPQPRPLPSWENRCAVMREHAALMERLHGPKGLVHFRKHAAAYLRGLPGAKKMRERLMTVSTTEQLEETLANRHEEEE